MEFHLTVEIDEGIPVEQDDHTFKPGNSMIDFDSDSGLSEAGERKLVTRLEALGVEVVEIVRGSNGKV